MVLYMPQNTRHLTARLSGVGMLVFVRLMRDLGMLRSQNNARHPCWLTTVHLMALYRLHKLV